MAPWIGAVLFGFFTSLWPSPHLGGAGDGLQKASRAISEATHQPTHNVTIFAFCIACLGVFARAARKPVLFAIARYSPEHGCPMILTAGTGGAAHHVICCCHSNFWRSPPRWPQIPWRPVVAAVTVAAVRVEPRA